MTTKYACRAEKLYRFFVSKISALSVEDGNKSIFKKNFVGLSYQKQRECSGCCLNEQPLYIKENILV